MKSKKKIKSGVLKHDILREFEISKSTHEGCSKSKVTSIFASYVHSSFEFLLLLCWYTRHDHMFTVLTI